jgi:hypothetical protein
MLEELKNKYPKVKFKYETMLNCKRCKGTGERYIPKQNRHTFCICTMVNHKFAEKVGDALRDFARKMKKQQEE